MIRVIKDNGTTTAQPVTARLAVLTESRGSSRSRLELLAFICTQPLELLSQF